MKTSGPDPAPGLGPKVRKPEPAAPPPAETWRPIFGQPGYERSSTGAVRRIEPKP